MAEPQLEERKEEEEVEEVFSWCFENFYKKTEKGKRKLKKNGGHEAPECEKPLCWIFFFWVFC